MRGGGAGKQAGRLPTAKPAPKAKLRTLPEMWENLKNKMKKKK